MLRQGPPDVRHVPGLYVQPIDQNPVDAARELVEEGLEAVLGDVGEHGPYERPGGDALLAQLPEGRQPSLYRRGSGLEGPPSSIVVCCECEAHLDCVELSDDVEVSEDEVRLGEDAHGELALQEELEAAPGELVLPLLASPAANIMATPSGL